MFAEETGLDARLIYADPENVTYDSMGFYKGFARTFFNPQTPLSINQRLLKDGAEDLRDIMPRWKPWIPPKLEQGLQQGPPRPSVPPRDLSPPCILTPKAEH